MRVGLLLFNLFFISCMLAVPSNSQHAHSVRKYDSAKKRTICQFIDAARFDTIADKQCIVYRAGDQYLMNWAIIFRSGDSLNVYCSEHKKKKGLFHRRTPSFDTTVFLNKYSSLFNWGMDSLPGAILKEKFGKREKMVFHNINMYVFQKDTLYNIPIPSDQNYENSDVELKVQKLLYLFMGLSWGDDRKYMPYPTDDLEITLPLDRE